MISWTLAIAYYVNVLLDKYNPYKMIKMISVKVLLLCVFGQVTRQFFHMEDKQYLPQIDVKVLDGLMCH